VQEGSDGADVGYLGSIGFGYPAAIGAWAAAPERPIFAVTGDGDRQYMAELLTAVKHGMNITHVLLNNGQLGKIAKEQRAGDWDVWQTSLHNPDFSRYAEICGAFARASPAARSWMARSPRRSRMMARRSSRSSQTLSSSEEHPALQTLPS